MLVRLVEGEGLDKSWRPLEQISPQLPQAVIASEDNRFCEHFGFDWKELRRSDRPGDRRAKHTRRQHDQHAGREERAALARARSPAQAARGAAHAAAGADLGQAADHGGLSQRRGDRARHVRRRGRGARLFRQAGQRSDPARGGADRGRPAQSATLVAARGQPPTSASAPASSSDAWASSGRCSTACADAAGEASGRRRSSGPGCPRPAPSRRPGRRRSA